MDPKTFKSEILLPQLLWTPYSSKGDNIKEFSSFKNETGKGIKFYFEVRVPSYSSWQFYNISQLGTKPLNWSQVAKKPKQTKPSYYIVSCKHMAT